MILYNEIDPIVLDFIQRFSFCFISRCEIHNRFFHTWIESILITIWNVGMEQCHDVGEIKPLAFGHVRYACNFSLFFFFACSLNVTHFNDVRFNQISYYAGQLLHGIPKFFFFFVWLKWTGLPPFNHINS